MMLAVIQCSIICHDITQDTMSLGLDGKKAMEQASGSYPLFSEQRSFDLLVDIRENIKCLSIKVIFFG